MKVVHWTMDRTLYEDLDARPDPVFVPGGGEGPGLFVYPIAHAVDWSGASPPYTRWPTYWEIPPRFCREVQRIRFARNEEGPGSLAHTVVELFVAPKDLHRLKRIG